MANQVGSFKATVKGEDKLNLEITLEAGRPSASGKNQTRATTAGFAMLPNGMKISYNIISPR